MAVSLGSFCKHCEVETMTELLEKRLSKNPAQWMQRLLDGALMATVAKHCAPRLHEAKLFELFTESLTRVRPLPIVI